MRIHYDFCFRLILPKLNFLQFGKEKPLFQHPVLRSIGLILAIVFVFALASTQSLLADDPNGPGGGEDPNAPPVAEPESVSRSSHGTPDSILIITFDGNGIWAPKSLNLYNNLVSLGYAVTHLYNPTPGVIETTLVAETFQQVWLFDIISFRQISESDAVAIAAWYASNSRGNIVVDARSYGSWFTPDAELPLTANYAHAFSLRCGGLWVGTDHSPGWAFNANPILEAMGYGIVDGIHGSVNVGTPAPSHELLNNPNVINLAGVHAFATPGVPPTGIQPDGTNLQVLFHNTSEGSKPLTSFALESNFCEVQTLPDLFIEKIEPVQVTFNTDINDGDKLDMVLGKPLAVRVTVSIVRQDLLPPGEAFDIQLEFEGKEPITLRKTLSELRAGPVDFFLTPEQLGDKLIRVTIDPNNLIEESDETNNQPSRTVEVKDTAGMTIWYREVEYHTIRPILFSETVIQGHDYTQAVYPIAPRNLNFHTVSTLYSTSGILSVDVRRDQLQIWWAARWEAFRLGLPFSRAVGIVPSNYFPDHGWGEDTNGNAFCTPGVPDPRRPGVCSGAVLVEEGFWTGTAHEIGHTFHLPEATAFDLTTGYWVSRRFEVAQGISFMGAGPFRSFTKPDEPFKGYLRWPLPNHYKEIFQQVRRGGEEDPSVLLVGGLVFGDGSIQLVALDWLPESPIEVPGAGDHFLQLIDAEGRIIQETAFVAAARQFESPHGPPADEQVGIFTLAVPYPEGTESLKIVHEDKTLLEFEVTSGLLKSAVDRIPDSGFINNPAQRRNALQNKIEALEHQIRVGNLTGAAEKMRHDIKPSLERWLIDDYQIENPLQYTKPGILALVDELLDRISAT